MDYRGTESDGGLWVSETLQIDVEGSSRTLVSNEHSPLLWLRNYVGKQTKLARWVLRLRDITFNLLRRLSVAIRVADAFSCNPI